jgi:hypothetical protein
LVNPVDIAKHEAIPETQVGMKLYLPALLSLFAFAQAEQKELPLKDYEDSKVLIGRLGRPFGTIIRLTCRSVEPSQEERLLKAEPWKDQVEVVAIEGNPVKPVIRINWSNFRADTVAKPPGRENIEVWAYESGSFQGLPAEISRYEQSIPADTGFSFVNTLVVIRKVKPEDGK